MEVIEISPSSSEKKKESEVTEISSSSSEKKKESEEEDSPLRPFFCLKKKAQMKELEDFFILDLDESPQPKQGDHDHDDVSIVAEKGQVACRDYPHPRHLCVKFPFHTTSHRSYCERCNCFVCDSAAHCELWTELGRAHCHASEYSAYWVTQRNSNLKKRQQQPTI